MILLSLDLLTYSTGHCHQLFGNIELDQLPQCSLDCWVKKEEHGNTWYKMTIAILFWVTCPCLLSTILTAVLAQVSLGTILLALRPLNSGVHQV